MTRNNWSREETIVAFNVYCKIPFNKSSKTHPTIIENANIIGRSPSALNMKVGNFGRLDPELKEKGIVGLGNGSKLDEEVWNEFHGNWDDLAFESETILANLRGIHLEELSEFNVPVGTDKLRMVKTRVNQTFFRSSILAAYNSTCCISRLAVPELLVASHIIPWRKNVERTNPRNGLCLNSLHDKAYDQGFISVTPEFEVKVSEYLLEYELKNHQDFFSKSDNKKIALPSKFSPKPEYLEYHFKNIYIK